MNQAYLVLLSYDPILGGRLEKIARTVQSSKEMAEDSRGLTEPNNRMFSKDCQRDRSVKGEDGGYIK